MTEPPTILVVDDEPLNIQLLKAFFDKEGFNTLTAENGKKALQRVKEVNVDLILLDVKMPVLSGIEVCKILKKDPEYRLIPIIFVTALSQIKDRIEGFDAGAVEYVNKPFNLDELYARVRASLKVKNLTDHLESAEGVLFALAAAVEARDEYTGQHVERVTTYSMSLGRKLNLSVDDLQDINTGARLHDIGKIAIPDKILLKPGQLTAEEFEEIKKHSQRGYDLCSGLKTIGGALDLILNHHEKLDGSGYPRGLTENEISLPARVLTVADIFDALTSSRCYRSGLSIDKSFEILFAQVEGKKLDGDVVGALKELYETDAELKNIIPTPN